MKVKLSVTTLIIVGTSFLYPQDIENYGIKIGLTSSNISKKNIKPLTIENPIYYVNYPDGQLISPTITFWAKF